MIVYVTDHLNKFSAEFLLQMAVGVVPGYFVLLYGEIEELNTNP